MDKGSNILQIKYREAKKKKTNKIPNSTSIIKTCPSLGIVAYVAAAPKILNFIWILELRILQFWSKT